MLSHQEPAATARLVLISQVLVCLQLQAALTAELALFLLLWQQRQLARAHSVQQGATLPLAHLHALPVVPAGTQLRLACHRSTTV